VELFLAGALSFKTGSALADGAVIYAKDRTDFLLHTHPDILFSVVSPWVFISILYLQRSDPHL
jgi:hypothetical protein